jgi:hypothetical protein
MRQPHAALLAATLLAGCGQPLFSARVEISEIRITEPTKEFPPAAFDPTSACSFLAPLPPNCVATSVAYDIGAELPVVNRKGVTLDLRLTDVALRLAAGAASDLRGVLRAEVDLRDPVSGDFTKVAGYVRPSPTAAPTTIAVSGSSNLDLARYLEAGALDARVAVEMDPFFLPSGFTADLEAGFSLVVTLDYTSVL